MEVPPAKPSAPALPSAFVVATGVSSDEDEDVEMELQKPLASANGPLSGVVKLTRQPHCVLWASATDEDDDEVLPPQTLPAATKAINPDIAEVCVGHGPDTRGGWQEVLGGVVRGIRHRPP
ncbi:hypothetical protein D1007_24765 [Hordeum vulgare]|nr:hypothetical protein D1007_24765 [Hordeum vulgare]